MELRGIYMAECGTDAEPQGLYVMAEGGCFRVSLRFGDDVLTAELTTAQAIQLGDALARAAREGGLRLIDGEQPIDGSPAA